MFSIILWKVISSDKDRHFPEIEFHILQQHILKIRWLTKWTIWNGLSSVKCSLIFKILTLFNNRSDDIEKLFKTNCKDLPTIWEGYLLCSRKVCYGNIFHFIFCLMIILVWKYLFATFVTLSLLVDELDGYDFSLIVINKNNVIICYWKPIGTVLLILSRVVPERFLCRRTEPFAINITVENNLWERFLRRAIKEARECCIIHPVCFHRVIQPVCYYWKIIGSNIVICTVGGGLKETVQK